MPPRHVRRSAEDVEAHTLEFAARGPFTSKELAGSVGFSSNRARQVLDQLVRRRKLKEVGKRSSGRGKPAVLYGLPGTRVRPTDTAPRTTRTSSGQSKRPAGSARAPATVAELPGLEVVHALLQNYAEGLLVTLPGGQQLEVRPLGTTPVSPSRRARSTTGEATRQTRSGARRGRPAGKKKAAAKKTAAKKKRSTGKKATAKKRTAGKKAAAKKTAAKKTAAKKRTAGKKAAAKKTAAKKPAAGKKTAAKKRSTRSAPNRSTKPPAESTAAASAPPPASAPVPEAGSRD